MRSQQPSRAAREAAGLALTTAARAARISPRYLARLEHANAFPYHLAEQLARRYGCRLEEFLPRGDGTPRKGIGTVRQRSRPLSGVKTG